MNKPQVLILSSVYDFSADLVALKLNEADKSFIRLNKEDLSKYALSLNPGIPVLKIESEEVNATITDELTSVWFRQPIFLRNTPSQPLSVQEQLERSQWSAFLRSLSVFDKAKWMNYPQATYLAECKPFQLYLANKCGFLIPSTLISNGLSSIKEIFHDQVAIKSIDTVLLRDGDDCLFTYTSFLGPEEIKEEEIRTAPVLVQTPIQEKTDIRVTIIGKQIFSVRILHNGHGIKGDWRIIPKENLEYTSFDLEGHLKESCFQLVNTLGLSFAAIDLAETSAGTYFLEVNPTGEWGWLSNKERSIDRAIAEWLADPGQ